MLEKLNEVLHWFRAQPSVAVTYYERRHQLIQLLKGYDLGLSEAVQAMVTLSHDRDGFVREAATRRLAKSLAPVALNAIVVNLNDWVSEVRQAASESASVFLTTERLPVVLAALEAIVHLDGKSRTDHRSFIDQVGDFLDQPEHRSSVLAHYRKSRGKVAKYLLLRMLRWPNEYQVEVVRLSIRHKDFLVRSYFLAVCEVSGNIGEDALRSLFVDRHPRNRQKAFLALWKTSPVDRQSLLEQALLDPSGAVRNVALWIARENGFDLTTFVSAFGDGRILAPRAYLGWLHLLGLLKNGTNLPAVANAFVDARPQVRRAALLAWVSISRDTADEPTVQAMLDRSPKVVKLAGQLLRKGKVLLSGEQLQRIGDELEKRDDLGRQLAFAQYLPYWERLVWMLELLSRQHGELERRQLRQAVDQNLRKQRYTLASQSTDMQKRLRCAIRESGLREDWRDNYRLFVFLEQFD